ncbi:hypothetical protein DSO57_1003861 [Entomophthora muscae]|uniref:Uncharacterized protein n=1 Tax=Entomophthora muscae TaxID=34485 RepID=A0ACC2RN85_9FUNG|nr:hypothetical protein DSO57_1003861 [Entomophthora muscae]
MSSASFFGPQTKQYVAFNWLGVCCSGAAVGVIVWMKYYREPRVSRVSLNLQAAISLVDMVRHIRLLFYDSNYPIICSFMGFLLFFGEHLNMLLNVAIAANLHRMLLQGDMPGKRWFKLLWVLPLSTAFIIDFIPLIFGVYGKVFDSYCFIRLDIPGRNILKVFILYVTTYPGLLYCLFISMRVFFARAHSHAPEVFDLRFPLLKPSATPIATRFSKRIALYPFSCFITNVGFMVVSFQYDITGSRSMILLDVAFIMQSLTGVLNLVCLFFDPSLKDSSQEIIYPISGAPIKRGLRKSDLWNDFYLQPTDSVLLLPCTYPTTPEEAYRFRDDLLDVDRYLDHL